MAEARPNGRARVRTPIFETIESEPANLPRPAEEAFVALSRTYGADVRRSALAHERRGGSGTFESVHFEDYTNALASSAPTPGGGSAAAVVAQTAAALVAMVARIALENPKLAAGHGAAADVARKADGLRDRLALQRTEDERAYGAVVIAMSLPRSTPDERARRTASLQAALVEAADAPLAIAEAASLVVRLAERALALENTNLTSDLGCAAEFGAAAVRAAAYNVRANLLYLKDRDQISRLESRLRKAESDVAAPLARVRFETDRALTARNA